MTDEEILAAWENAFDHPVYLNHKPTEDDILLIRLKAVIGKERERIMGKLSDEELLLGAWSKVQYGGDIIEYYEERIMNESRLYDALGKEDARSVLTIWERFKRIRKEWQALKGS